MLWQDPNGGYTVWQTDAAGNYQDSKSKSEAALNEIEALFAADLNGDGGIGVIEDNGAYQLAVNDERRLSDQRWCRCTCRPEAQLSGCRRQRPLMVGLRFRQRPPTRICRVVAGSQWRYTVWQTDAAGNYQDSKPKPETALNEIEALFAVDLNGDGGIGVIEDNGAHQLGVNAEGAYQISNGVGTPVVLKLSSLDVTPTTFDGWSALQAEATATGFTVLWQDPSGGYAVWQTDAAGNYQDSSSLVSCIIATRLSPGSPQI